jgi:hypothetical protein
LWIRQKIYSSVGFLRNSEAPRPVPFFLGGGGAFTTGQATQHAPQKTTGLPLAGPDQARSLRLSPSRQPLCSLLSTASRQSTRPTTHDVPRPTSPPYPAPQLLSAISRWSKLSYPSSRGQSKRHCFFFGCGWAYALYTTPSKDERTSAASTSTSTPLRPTLGLRPEAARPALMGGRAAHTVESKALVRIGAAMGQAAQLPPPQKTRTSQPLHFFGRGCYYGRPSRAAPPPQNTRTIAFWGRLSPMQASGHFRTAFVLCRRRRCTGPPFIPSTVPSAFHHWLWCSCACVGAAAAGVLSGAWCVFAVAPRRASSGHALHVCVTGHWGDQPLCSAPACDGANSIWPGGLGRQAAWERCCENSRQCSI